MFKKISKILLASTIVASVSFASEHCEKRVKAPVFKLGVNPMSAVSNLNFDFGGAFRLARRVEMVLDADLTFRGLVSGDEPTTASPYIFERGETTVRIYSEPGNHGFFATAGFGCSIRGLVAPDGLTLASDISGKLDNNEFTSRIDIYATAGFGHQIRIGHYLSITNRIYVIRPIYTFNRPSANGTQIDNLNNVWFGGQTELSRNRNSIGENLKFEIMRLEINFF